jgi:hypothetical protein
VTRRALVFCSILAALTIASASTAAFVVTSKNIKNGTIQPIDLSAKTKRSLRGFQTVERLRGFVAFSYASPGPKTATVTCPPGTILTGGGFQSDPNGLNQDHVVVSESGPVEGAEAWRVTGRYAGGGLVAILNGYALCAH